MKCVKCSAELPEQSLYCNYCGKKQISGSRPKKKRGNGQGTVYQLPNKKWRAVITLAYTENGKRITRSNSTSTTKKAALELLPTLLHAPKKANRSATLKDVYDVWLPTHKCGESTKNCYRAAMNHLKPLWYVKFNDLGIDDYQECMDDCALQGHGATNGKRTRQNMKALIGLLYKYAVPRGYTDEKLILGEYLRVDGGEEKRRRAFTKLEIEQIRQAVGTVPYAGHIYCMIYTGFRPSEFLGLDIAKNYLPDERCFIGGGKTEAGTNRIVTISPKIQPVVDKLTGNRTSGPIFPDEQLRPIGLKKFRQLFKETLSAIGINEDNSLTPYCCRHTFASLMIGIKADDREKLELMGHTDTSMLRHYQHPDYDGLRKITDAL